MNLFAGCARDVISESERVVITGGGPMSHLISRIWGAEFAHLGVENVPDVFRPP